MVLRWGGWEFGVASWQRWCLVVAVLGWGGGLAEVVVLDRGSFGLGFLSCHAWKGEVRRLSVLTDDVALWYLQDVLVWEWCWMVKAECEWFLSDTKNSDHFQIWWDLQDSWSRWGVFKSVETCRSLVSGRILRHQVLTVDSLTTGVPRPLSFGATFWV